MVLYVNEILFNLSLFHIIIEECGYFSERYLFKIVVEVTMIGIGNNQ